MKLQRVGESKFCIVTTHKRIEAPFIVVCAVLEHCFDVSRGEIERAVGDMIANGNDVAHFGLNKTFLFSENYHMEGAA